MDNHLCKDILPLIYGYLDWRKLSLMRCVCTFHKDIITKNATKLVKNIKEDDNIKYDEHVFYNCCYELNFTFMGMFEWKYLLQYSNKLHYLSFNYSVLQPMDLCEDGYVLQHLDAYNDTTESIKKFMYDNFTEEDVNVFFGWKDSFWFGEYSNHTDFSLLHIKPKTSRERYGFDGHLSLRIVSSVDKDHPLYDEYVRIIRYEIDETKKLMKIRRDVENWFNNAEIDVIDISFAENIEWMVKLLTYCKKKKIISSCEQFDHDTKISLQKSGVEIVEVMDD